MKRSLRLLALLLMFTCQLALAQDKRNISGVVHDAKGIPLPGVTIIEKGTKVGTTTDVEGKFTLSVSTNAILQVSMVGYGKTEVSTVSKHTLDISLSEDSKGLGEVVVTALGIKQSRKSLGYAVSTIKADDITVAGTTINPVAALYGKASGVGIVAASGGPMAGINIKIRGASSLTSGDGVNNRPLIVVDGVVIRDAPTSMAVRGYDPLHSVDYGSGINDINPDDIASIDVLKGAKATALYGEKGANGVLMITTKSGANARGFGVTLSHQRTTEKPVNYIDFQNEYGSGLSPYDTSYKVVNGVRQRQIISSRFSFGPKFNNEPIRYFDGTVRPYSAVPDNFMSLFQNGSSNRTNVAIAGSSDKGSMRLSYTNYGYDDILENSWQKQNTFSFNGQMKASKFATFEVTSNLYSITSNNRRPSIDGLVAWGMNRDYPLSQLRQFYKDETGHRPDLDAVGLPNMVTKLFDFWWNQYDNFSTDKKLHMISSAKATLNFTDDIAMVNFAGIDYTNTDYVRKDKETRIVPEIQGGLYSQKRDNYTIQTYQSHFTYNHDFVNKNLHVYALAGGSVQQDNDNSVFASSTGGFRIPGWFSVNNSKTFPSLEDAGKARTSSRGSRIVYSVFGSLQLGWKDKYFVEVTDRQDWNSTLYPSNNSFNYPSLSFTWDFTKDLKIPELQYGKFRIGWADVGKGTNTNYYAYKAYEVGSIVGYNNAATIITQQDMFANQLFSERKREYEVGFEAGFFERNRLSADFSFYTNNVYKQIMGVDLSPATGYNSIKINSGNVKNWGYEISLKGIPVMTKDLTWTVGINAASQRSKVLKLYPGITTNNIAGNAGFKVIAAEGRPVNDIQMYDYKKDPNGNNIVNANGLYTLSDQLSTVGNTQTKVLGGVFSDLTYKGVSLHIGLDYKFGGKIFSYTNYYLTGLGVTKNTLAYRDEDHGGLTYYIDKTTKQNVKWTNGQPAPANAQDGRVYHDGMVLPGVKAVDDGSGKITYVNNDIITSSTAYYQTYISDLSTGWGPDRLFKNDYIKVRELSLSYAIPTRFLKPVHLQGAKITAAARNLFYIYKTLPNVDPESTLGSDIYIENSFYPSIRTYSIGVNVSF
ncbi:SusC/RagA family TonB-linked outer membrane protein [Chitinophaga sp. Cy-1792]|uniref:SusC/RagA family TonB-linked outer membrane protein n=1 Tax=Chitinophaga sp. Cy-1792 TaxID=2608339 RepID=UPI0014241BCD|nr:SusC/RagA family TonB-linked outer membrane protein [Chitinophaga sp. Cy-1792]NIG57231.1 SusC/RagA family TonB-linked outer membrane protein [Chitinophaga sp. Cy-1792]